MSTTCHYCGVYEGYKQVNGNWICQKCESINRHDWLINTEPSTTEAITRLSADVAVLRSGMATLLTNYQALYAITEQQEAKLAKLIADYESARGDGK